jgi:uncharacterized protein YecE (DUF72 family)
MGAKTVGDVQIGTSGWNYPTGPFKWSGLFYPIPGRGKKKDFDDLRYYSERFNTVEINSTFYRPPTVEMAKSWVLRTPKHFEFSVKLFQRFTHPKMFADATAGKETQSRRADRDQVRRALDVIASAGKLGAVLCQFPASFKSTPESQDILVRLFRDFDEYRLAVELRHASWSQDVAGTLTLLNTHGAAWVQIDEPKFRFSIRQNQLPNITSFYYMRLHGRNAQKWWRHQHRDERYDYLYSAEQVREFAETVDAVRHIVKKTYVYTNNHPNAQSVVNALQLKKMLGESITGDYSPELVERYPPLTEVVPHVQTATDQPVTHQVPVPVARNRRKLVRQFPR